MFEAANYTLSGSFILKLLNRKNTIWLHSYEITSNNTNNSTWDKKHKIHALYLKLKCLKMDELSGNLVENPIDAKPLTNKDFSQFRFGLMALKKSAVRLNFWIIVEQVSPSSAPYTELHSGVVSSFSNPTAQHIYIVHMKKAKTKQLE